MIRHSLHGASKFLQLSLIKQYRPTADLQTQWFDKLHPSPHPSIVFHGKEVMDRGRPQVSKQQRCWLACFTAAGLEYWMHMARSHICVIIIITSQPVHSLRLLFAQSKWGSSKPPQTSLTMGLQCPVVKKLDDVQIHVYATVIYYYFLFCSQR